ncbi:BatD family protein [Vibrio hannami]|uniref:BatD family protein n=1 Tax=Vibrio hannami TaxID=2717094 RepID=UPI0024107C06|nr:BatD family protein [Vibrio hannami]MDG3086095.1 BatD family protein [Vibrio hannami]
MIKRYRKPFTSTIWALLSLSLVFFSQLSIAATASVSSNKLAKSEVFQLKIVANENLDADDIDFSVLEDDFFTGKPRFGFYTNITNGKKTVKSEWTLALAPLRSGILTIPSFQVGKQKTQPISITVTVDPSAKTEQDLVDVQVKLEKSELYPGELNTLTTRLIIKADSRQIQSANIVPPALQGTDSGAINMEPIGEQKQYQAVIDGMEVIVVDQDYKITATQSGKFVINGPSLKGAILDSNRRSGNSRVIPINTKPETLVLSVLNRPDDFQGNWLPSSNLTLKQKWLDESGSEITANPANLVTGSPITRQIELTVKGVATEQLPNLKVDYPESVRVYEDSPQIKQQGDTATLTLNQVLIARNAGEIPLPEVAISWWNTSDKKQDHSVIPGLMLQVSQSENSPQAVVAPAPVNESPEAKVVTKTETIKDAGYWPYIAGLFALLWVITLALLIKARNTKQANNDVSFLAENSDSLHALVEAIKSRDGFKTNALLNKWLSENPELSGALTDDIKAEIALMHQSLFDDKQTNWSEKRVLKLLINASKQRGQKNSASSLASL